MSVNPEPAPSPDLQVILERLRVVQDRIDSLEQTPSASTGLTLPASVEADLARQLFEAQNVRDSMKSFEERQLHIYREAVGDAAIFEAEMERALDERFFPKINGLFEREAAAMQERGSALALTTLPYGFDSRLEEIEKRFQESRTQFGALLEKAVATELSVMESEERLDAIWADQNTEGIGAWRLALRDISSTFTRERLDSPDEFSRLREYDEPAVERKPVSNISCPKCHKNEVRRLARQSMIEELLRLAFVNPYRCHDCSERFYRMRPPWRD